LEYFLLMPSSSVQINEKIDANRQPINNMQQKTTNSLGSDK